MVRYYLTAGVEVSRAQLWLVQAPERLDAAVWDVVCLAALSAMEFGRRRLAVGRGLVGAVPVAVAAAGAVADFWGRLSGFVALRVVPRGWGSVPLTTPSSVVCRVRRWCCACLLGPCLSALARSPCECGGCL